MLTATIWWEDDFPMYEDARVYIKKKKLKEVSLACENGRGFIVSVAEIIFFL